MIYLHLIAQPPAPDIIVTKKKILAACFLAGLLLLIAAGCGNSTENVSTTPTFGGYTSTTNGPVTKDLVAQLVNNALGTTTQGGGPLIRDVTLTPAAAGVAVKIDINRTPCPEIATETFCRSGQLPGVALDATSHLMVTLFRYTNVSQAELDLYGTSQQPQDADKLAVKVVFTKDAAAKTDWSSLSETNIAQLATTYWVDPSVSEAEQQLSAAASSIGLPPGTAGLTQTSP